VYVNSTCSAPPSATPDHIRTDDAATGETQIEVPAGDVLFLGAITGTGSHSRDGCVPRSCALAAVVPSNSIAA
jgi:hypothetical protein